MEIKRDSYLQQPISYRFDGLVKVIAGACVKIGLNPEKPFVRLFSPDYADYLSFKNPPSKYLGEELNQCCPKLRRASAIVTASVTETKPDSFSVFQKVSAQPVRLHPTSMKLIML